MYAISQVVTISGVSFCVALVLAFIVDKKAFSIYFPVLLCLAIIGGCLGYVGGMSRTPVVAEIVPAVLGLLGGASVITFGLNLPIVSRLNNGRSNSLASMDVEGDKLNKKAQESNAMEGAENVCDPNFGSNHDEGGGVVNSRFGGAAPNQRIALPIATATLLVSMTGGFDVGATNRARIESGQSKAALCQRLYFDTPLYENKDLSEFPDRIQTYCKQVIMLEPKNGKS